MLNYPKVAFSTTFYSLAILPRLSLSHSSKGKKGRLRLSSKKSPGKSEKHIKNGKKSTFLRCQLGSANESSTGIQGSKKVPESGHKVGKTC